MVAPALGLLVAPGSQDLVDVAIEPDPSGDTHLRSLYAALDVSYVELITLSDGILLWVDEEALLKSDVLANEHLTNMLQTFGWFGQTILGRGVFLSSNEGATTSLSDAQRAIITNAHEQAKYM